MPDEPQPEGRVLFTVRVSRDGGRTFGEPTEARTTDHLPPLLLDAWPPCRCSRCRRH